MEASVNRKDLEESHEELEKLLLSKCVSSIEDKILKKWYPGRRLIMVVGNCWLDDMRMSQAASRMVARY